MPTDANLTQTRLWETFAAKADDQQRLMVRNLVDGAGAHLDLIRDTFPAYTLHNALHSVNVVKLMGELLGPRIEEITALEGAVLIISAYLHDSGMVFTDVEREGLEQQPRWGEFLKEHRQAELSIHEDGGVSEHTAEWYCRWAHPERVGEYLRTLGDGDLRWGPIPIAAEIQSVCESHGWDAGRVRDDDALKTSFLAGTGEDDEADLRFCAMVLRLADILDFDNTRAPAAVYGHLGLDRPDSPREETSAAEWQKHMSAMGFRFPEGERDRSYPLRFVALPKDPGVEHGVRNFLKVIDDEVLKCARVVHGCSRRWADFALPDAIGRGDIKSDGYKYGEHRFTLDKDQVLDLLMGENLYPNPYVFIRELLQNALDASRHREVCEHRIGNAAFKAEPIDVSTWTDDEGCQWVRVDDCGMGMDEEIIEKFLLKVGQSYYQSPEFRADVLRYAAQGEREFVPISRFGIGILSCFIVGDRVEVSTRRVSTSGGRPPGIRLSMSRARQLYTMCLDGEGHAATPMPGEGTDDEGYRQSTQCGTSVAVRIDPTKDDGSLYVPDELQRHVAYPTVSVRFEGVAIGGDHETAIRTPWCGPDEYTLTPEEMAKVSDCLDITFTAPIKVVVVPLDITAHSPDPRVQGQGIAVCPRLDPADTETLRMSDANRALSVGYHGKERGLRMVARYSDNRRNRRREADIGLQLLHREINAEGSPLYQETDWSQTWVSQNGLRVPNHEDMWLNANFATGSVTTWTPVGRDEGWFTGHVLLDGLRPTVSVARDTLFGLPAACTSALTLALRRAYRASGGDAAYDPGGLVPHLGDDLLVFDAPTYDDETQAVDAAWKDEVVIATDDGDMSIAQVLARTADGMTIVIRAMQLWGLDPFRSSYRPACRWVVARMLQSDLTVVLHTQVEPMTASVGGPAPAGVSGSNLQGWLPLLFLRYDASHVLRLPDYPINTEHPLGAWLAEHAEFLRRRYPALLVSVCVGLYRTELHLDADRRQWALGLVNTALRRLFELPGEETAPPPGLVLTEADFIL